MVQYSYLSGEHPPVESHDLPVEGHDVLAAAAEEVVIVILCKQEEIKVGLSLFMDGPLCSDKCYHTYLVFLEAHHHELKDELVDGGCEGGEADENENERTDDVPGVELEGKRSWCSSVIDNF